MSTLPDGFFRDLSPDEQAEFRRHARANFKPTTDTVNPCWHPVYRDECNIMLRETLAVARCKDAYYIANGACNPVAVVNSLQRHIASMRDAGCDHPTITGDPSIRLMVHQLGHLCRTYAFDLGNSGDEYRTCYDAVERAAKAHS